MTYTTREYWRRGNARGNLAKDLQADAERLALGEAAALTKHLLSLRMTEELEALLAEFDAELPGLEAAEASSMEKVREAGDRVRKAERVHADGVAQWRDGQGYYPKAVKAAEDAKGDAEFQLTEATKAKITHGKRRDSLAGAIDDLQAAERPETPWLLALRDTLAKVEVS